MLLGILLASPRGVGATKPQRPVSRQVALCAGRRNKVRLCFEEQFEGVTHRLSFSLAGTEGMCPLEEPRVPQASLKGSPFCCRRGGQHPAQRSPGGSSVTGGWEEHAAWGLVFVTLVESPQQHLSRSCVTKHEKQPTSVTPAVGWRGWYLQHAPPPCHF